MRSALSAFHMTAQRSSVRNEMGFFDHNFHDCISSNYPQQVALSGRTHGLSDHPRQMHESTIRRWALNVAYSARDRAAHRRAARNSARTTTTHATLAAHHWPPDSLSLSCSLIGCFLACAFKLQ
jgi:hypothetical protein